MKPRLLSDTEVQQVRAMVAMKRWPINMIAEYFEVSSALIIKVKDWKTYKDVPATLDVVIPDLGPPGHSSRYPARTTVGKETPTWLRGARVTKAARAFGAEPAQPSPELLLAVQRYRTEKRASIRRGSAEYAALMAIARERFNAGDAPQFSRRADRGGRAYGEPARQARAS